MRRQGILAAKRYPWTEYPKNRVSICFRLLPVLESGRGEWGLRPPDRRSQHVQGDEVARHPFPGRKTVLDRTADKAIAFYVDLFGWGKYEIPIDDTHTYTMFTLEGENASALSDMLPEGVPSFWFNYVTVEDVDSLAEVVTANGGQIVYGPFDVFDRWTHAAYSGSGGRSSRLVAAEAAYRRRHRQYRRRDVLE